MHTKRMPLDGVNLDAVARSTDGYTGADLASVCREAGLAAYREDPGAAKVCQRHFDVALGLVMPSVTKEVMDGYEDAGRRIRRRRTGWDSVPFYGRSVPPAGALVTLAVVVAGGPRGSLQPPLGERLHGGVRIPGASRHDTYARSLEPLHRTAPEAPADERGDIELSQHIDELAVTPAARTDDIG